MRVVITDELKKQLQKEIPYVRTEIQKLFRELDKKLGLHGADLPIEFTYDTEQLGAYVPASDAVNRSTYIGDKSTPDEGRGKLLGSYRHADETVENSEHFRFSLPYIGYLDSSSLHKQDKMDLYKHEYAHYMQFHMEIPKEYQWQSGLHGSAWKYCCSLIGAAPTEYYHKDEGKQTHDYDKALQNPWKNKHTALLDIAHRKKEAEDQKNRVIRYQVGDIAVHPKFGEGIVEEIEQLQGSVRLHIRFGQELKKIDQKWLEKSRYHKKN